MFRFVFFLLLLTWGPYYSFALTKVEGPETISKNGKSYQLYYGNEQFLEDFNKAFMASGKNSGVIRMPARHAYAGVNLPLLGDAEKIKGQLITEVELAYAFNNGETKLWLTDYNSAPLPAQDCCRPPSSWAPIKVYSKDKRDVSLQALESRTILIDGTNYFEYEYTFWPNETVHLERNQSKKIYFMFHKGKGALWYSAKKRQLCSATLTIRKGLSRPSSQSLTGTPAKIGTYIDFEHELNFAEAGIYQLTFNTVASRRTDCDGNKIRSSVNVYVCVKFPEGRPRQPANPPQVTEYACGETEIKTTIAASDFSSDLEYYWSTSGSRPSRSFRGQVKYTLGDPIISGKVPSSGYWRLYAYFPCSNTWSLAGPSAYIKVHQLNPPGIRAAKSTLCEGETTTLTSFGAPEATIRWYKVNKRNNGNPYTYLGQGTELSVSEAGFYVAKASRNFEAVTGQCYSDFSRELEIKVVAAPQPTFSLSTERLLIDEAVTASFNNTYYVDEDELFEMLNAWEFKVDWGDGREEALEPLIMRMGAGGFGDDFYVLFFLSKKHDYRQADDYTVSYTIRNANGCTVTATEPVSVYQPLCTTTLPLNAELVFKKNKYTGQFAFENDCYSSTALGCISDQPAPEVLSLAVQATARTLSDDWPAAGAAGDEGNAYETGEKGNWRLSKTYAFKSRLIPSNVNTTAGRFNHIYFDWETSFGKTGTNWVNTARIQQYEQNGQPVQEVNALGIHSAAKYGYGNTVPYLVAQNAPYEAVFFESFESTYEGSGNPAYEEGFTPDPSQASRSVKGVAHAGGFSLQLKGSTLNLPALKVQHFADKGFSLRFWVKAPSEHEQGSLHNYLHVAVPVTDSEMNLVESSFTFDGSVEKVIARTGEWVLFEKKFSGMRLASGGVGEEGEGREQLEGMVMTPQIMYSGSEPIWIDDIRVQPLDAQLSTFVYDPHTLRLLTTFDDQHFGIYHQYDDEGRLVRKMIETERGIRTLQEKHVNVPRTEPRPATN